MPTYNPTAGSGYGEKFDANWSNVKSGTGSSVKNNDDIRCQSHKQNDASYQMQRGFLNFDTSGIPDAATVTGATLRLYCTVSSVTGLSNTGVRIVASTQADPATLTTSDWSSVGASSLASSSSPTENAYSSFAIAVGNISKTGYTKFAVRSERDFDNVAPEDNNDSELFVFNGPQQASNKPELVITYIEAPTVTTSAATDIKAYQATGNGNVTSDGDSTITERGFCWSTSSNPTTADSTVVVAGTTGAYTGTMSTLLDGTLYHYRAYATNTVGTSYGADTQFTTLNALNTSVRANINPASLNNVKANIIRVAETGDMTVKASIVTTPTKNLSVKAWLPTNVKGSSARACIRTISFKKTYSYRIYDGSTYVTTWFKEVISTPRFRTIINGGSSELVIRIDRKFDDFGEDVDVKLNNTIEAIVHDREAPNGTRIYYGFISGYKPVLDGNNEYVEITILSFTAEAALTQMRNPDGSTEVSFSNVDPAQMMRDVIDLYIRDGGQLNYSATSIVDTGTTASYTFETNSIKEAMDKIVELCPAGWYYYVHFDGLIHMKSKDVAPTHTFRAGREIQQMETWRRIEDVINRVYFVGGGDPQLYRVYENSGSIVSYGLKTYRQIDQRVTVTATADTMANRTLNSRKDPEVRTTLTINDNNGPLSGNGYDIESIRVGDTFEIGNLKQGVKTFTLWDVGQWDVDVWDQTLAYTAVSAVQILSIDYSPNEVRLEASSRIPQIATRIDKVSRDINQSALNNNPSSPVAG